MSVWETNGGLQPQMEDMDLPLETFIPLDEWALNTPQDLHCPSFTRRTEYDAKGRILALQLQQQLGERIHVNFRAWVEFDPNGWQTKWHEEDLLTGDSTEFWIEEDLPEDIVVKIISVFPDACGVFLWDLDAGCIDNSDPAFSEDLYNRFTTWSEFWDSCYDSETNKVDKTQLAEARFDEQGVNLTKELKMEIGEQARVIYYPRLSEEAIEVLGDGSLKQWANETDFRQQALDAWLTAK